MHYLRQHGTKVTSQSEPIPGSDQIENSAGGHTWAVSKWTRLERFLILGSEGGSYYASQRDLTTENVACIDECLNEDPARFIAVVVQVSESGRAPKNDPAIYALARAASHQNDWARKAALEALPKVCRIGTHLFHFAAYVETMRGWGRGLRKAIGAWYQQPVDRVAYQAVKYRQRDGWSHRDLLRLAHPAAPSEEHKALYTWMTGHGEWTGQVNPKLDGREVPEIVKGYMAAQAAASPEVTAALVREFSLPREALQTEHLNDPAVWEALLDADMPMTALIRNLATMTRVGLLTPTSEATRKVVEQIGDGERIRKARVHPIQVLMAARTYAAGRGLRSKNTWTALPQIVDALDEAFYAAFDNVEATGARRCIALDISGSMWGGMVAGIPDFTPAEAAGAMALVSMRTGDPYEVVAFTASRGYYGYGSRRSAADAPPEPIPGLSVHALSAKQRLDDVCRYMHNLSHFMGGTDCALPMLYASQEGREFDVFEVFTDSETWAGTPHPSQALAEYRAQSGIDAKLVVYGMVSNGFSIADPNDKGMMDVVGFDAAVPQVVQGFIQGGI